MSILTPLLKLIVPLSLTKSQPADDFLNPSESPELAKKLILSNDPILKATKQIDQNDLSIAPQLKIKPKRHDKKEFHPD